MCCNIWAATPIVWPSPTIAWSRSAMAKSLFAGVILLTTTNRSCCPYRSMNSRAASYCISFHKASCASLTSAFWPTAAVPLSYRFAFTSSARHNTRKPNKQLLHQRLFRSLALPQVRWPDEGRRAAHGCSNPTPLSAGGHRCSMKALSTIRILPVSQRGSHLSAWPSDYSLLSASPTTFFILLFPRNELLQARCHVVHPGARPWRTSTPLLPIIEFP